MLWLQYFCRSRDCFQIGWPMRLDHDFFCFKSLNEPKRKNIVEEKRESEENKDEEMGLNEDEEPGVNFITLGHLSIFFLFPDCY